MSELVEVTTKINRARNNIENIKKLRAGDDPSKMPGNDLTYKTQPDGLSYDFFVKIHQPSTDFRLGVGDIIHDLRSALDYLIYRILVHRGGLTEAQKTGKLRKVQFLIYDDAHKFKAAAGHFKPLIGDDVITAMERLQKYDGAADVRRLTLWQLAELDNISKHRMIPVVSKRLIRGEVAVTIGDVCETRAFDNPERKALEDGAKLFTLAFDQTPPEMNVELKGSQKIVFTDTGICDGLSVIPMLREFVSAVDSVVNEFRTNFLL